MIHQSELPPQATASTGHYVADHAGYYWQAYTRRNQALGNGCRVIDYNLKPKHNIIFVIFEERWHKCLFSLWLKHSVFVYMKWSIRNTTEIFDKFKYTKRISLCPWK